MTLKNSSILRWIITLATLFISFIIALILVIPLDPPAKSVILEVGGVTYPVTTYAKTVSEFIGEQALIIETGDILNPGLYDEITDGITIQINRARTVILTVDGRTSILRTTFDSPLDILRSAGIEPSPSDIIAVDGRLTEKENLVLWPLPVSQIVIRSAIEVTILDSGAAITLQTSSDTVGEALFEAGIDLYLADTVTPDISAALEPDMQIVVNRSRDVTVMADGEVYETRTGGTSVYDVLLELGITLTGLDYTVPSENSGIIPGMSVRVIRVTEQLIDEEETIPYQTIYQADAELALDNRRVLQAGQNGVIRRTQRVRYENGIEISRIAEGDAQVTEPQDEIIAYGTQVIIRTLGTPDGPVEYWRKLRLYTSSYHPAAVGGHNITAIGETLRKGIVGVDPDIIPYRTYLYVEGYGVGMAADTGAPRANPYWVELGYEDHDHVLWHQWMDVYILTPVPDEIDYLLPLRAEGGPIP